VGRQRQHGADVRNPTGLIFPNILAVAGAADDPAAPTSGLQGVNPPNFAVNMPAPIGLKQRGGSASSSAAQAVRPT